MKKTVILTAAALLVLAASPAWASDFSVFGAYQDTEDLEDTVGGGVKAGFGDNLQLELRATYLPDLTENFSSFIHDPGVDPNGFENDIKAIPVEAGVKYKFGLDQAAFAPYVGAGGSYYFLDAERGEIDDEAGFYVEGGLELGRPGSNFGFFAEAIYRDVQAKVTHDPDEFDEFDDVDLAELRKRDLDVGGLGVNAGVTWRW